MQQLTDFRKQELKQKVGKWEIGHYRVLKYYSFLNSKIGFWERRWNWTIVVTISNVLKEHI